MITHGQRSLKHIRAISGMFDQGLFAGSGLYSTFVYTQVCQYNV